MAKRAGENKQEQPEKGQQLKQTNEQNGQPEQPSVDNTNETNETNDEHTTPEEQPKAFTVQWLVNVKYQGKRFRAGEITEIQADDRESLLSDGLIKVKDE